MSASLDDLIPEFVPIARDFVDQVASLGLQPQVTSTLRTHSQQQRLYDEYLRGGRGYPVAPPGTSAHEFGYAFDMVVNVMDYLWDLGQYWISIGGVWGPGDAIHFQYPGFKAPTGIGQFFPPLGHVTSTIADLGISFIPGFGTPTAVAQILGALGFDDNEIVFLLEHPSEILRYVPQWQLISKVIG